MVLSAVQTHDRDTLSIIYKNYYTDYLLEELLRTSYITSLGCRHIHVNHRRGSCVDIGKAMYEPNRYTCNGSKFSCWSDTYVPVTPIRWSRIFTKKYIYILGSVLDQPKDIICFFSKIFFLFLFYDRYIKTTMKTN